MFKFLSFIMVKNVNISCLVEGELVLELYTHLKVYNVYNIII